MADRMESMFSALTGVLPDRVETVSAAGSPRVYVRLSAGEVSYIGVTGTSLEENRSFIAISSHFREKGLNVPRVLAVSEDGMQYIQEDLGDVSLFGELSEGRKTGNYSDYERELLVKTIRELPRIQVLGAEDFDFNCCYQEKEFGPKQVMFDLNYFKYCFLKPSGLDFNETLLENDFERLRDSLCAFGLRGFLYRDFQARNVMLCDGTPYFIDFQGGQKGPLQYDLASFVWQARAAYPSDLRERLVAEYLDSLSSLVRVDESEFRSGLRLFVLFRTLQVLGCYGFRGLFERKRHFIESIPYAIANLREMLETPFPEYPYLSEILERLADKCQKRENRFLEVQVSSFSYKRGIPEDTSGNGGGYVFDCRSIHNPGKYEQYRHLTGMDRPVIDFLEKDGEILRFLEQVYALVDAHVERFLERKFTHLTVSFGCTGGQHRSVYCAEALSRHLFEKYGVRVRLCHREQEVSKSFD